MSTRYEVMPPHLSPVRPGPGQDASLQEKGQVSSPPPAPVTHLLLCQAAQLRWSPTPRGAGAPPPPAQEEVGDVRGRESSPPTGPIVSWLHALWAGDWVTLFLSLVLWWVF